MILLLVLEVDLLARGTLLDAVQVIAARQTLGHADKLEKGPRVSRRTRVASFVIAMTQASVVPFQLKVYLRSKD